MTVVYLAEYKIRWYEVTFQNFGWIKVKKFEDISDDEIIIFCVKPWEIFSSKSKVCDMTLFSGAFDQSIFDGKTMLLKISTENDINRYVYFGGDMICFILTNDNSYKYISNMGNNLTPFSIVKTEENNYFLTPHFIFIKRKKINDNELFKKNKGNVDPLNYHVSNCGKYSFRKLRI